MTDWMREARGLQPWLEDLRHRLHRCPELGFDLPETTAVVCRVLTELDIPFERILPCGLLARIGRSDKRKVLLRADMDALPITEESGVPFSSEHPGRMHACGHDLHTTMLLGAARMLKARETTLEGQVLLMFQPSEETMEGAIGMLEAGILRDRPDAAFSMHVFPDPVLPTGTVRCPAHIAMASSDQFRITLRGKSCHGSTPHLGINPITGAARLVECFSDLARNEADPFCPVALSVCKIQAGSQYNIVPETCQLEGSLRTHSPQVRQQIKARMSEIVSGITSACRLDGVLEFPGGVPCTVNDPALAVRIHDALAAMKGSLVEEVGDTGIMVSEDFAYISEQLPSCLFFLYSHSPEGCHFPGHSAHVVFDDDVLWRGSAVYACAAQTVLSPQSPATT